MAGHFQPNPALLERFGLREFRPGQQQVIEAVLAGEDCLCIMPTGGGKSLCFQFPAVARDGLVIVISPLIALMKDQVDTLSRRNISATYINSSLDFREQQERCQRMIEGQYDLIYVAPERLRNAGFLEQVAQSRLQLLAIDEAHCISQWGHDFRPDYARIGKFRNRLGKIQTIALTATATTTVREDIVNLLDLDEPATFVKGFARDNLALAINEVSHDAEKDQLLIQFLDRHPGSGIVYAATRKNCEHLDELLRKKTNRSVGYYHAGLEANERRTIQEKFIQGDTEIIVATNAFGMGIDKSDVRFVAHYNLPGSIEAYYQEAGRAGRDGLLSHCQMLHGYRDRFIQEFFIENAYPAPDAVEAVYDYLRAIKSDPIELTLQDIKDDLDLPIGMEGVRVCENLLEKAGVLERLDVAQNQASIKINSSLPSTVDLLPRDARTQRRVLREIEKVVGDLRNERVYFQTGEIARRLKINVDSVHRAIRSINELDVFDYVPAFRGRAVHMLERQARFRDLAIDFDELNRRKAAEYARLDQVTRFAKSTECRQATILKYFGDPDGGDCQKCDNCRRVESDQRQSFDNEDRGSLYAVQVVISGAVRVSGRVGKNLIAQMLCGSEAQKVKQLGLQKLSTFGLLSSLKQTEVVALIDALVNARLLVQENIQKFRPVIKPTRFGRSVMKGQSFPDFVELLGPSTRKRLNRLFLGKSPHLDQSQPQPEEHEASNSVSGNSLSENSLSGEGKNRDRLDAEPIRESKSTLVADEAGLKGGFDSGQLEPSENHQDVNEVTEAVESRSERIDEPPIVTPEFSPETAPQFYWTWYLLNEGFELEVVCRIRNIDEESALSDLIRARDAGLSVKLEWMSAMEPELESLAGESLDGFWTRVKRLDAAALSPRLKLLLAKCEPRSA